LFFLDSFKDLFRIVQKLKLKQHTQTISNPHATHALYKTKSITRASAWVKRPSKFSMAQSRPDLSRNMDYRNSIIPPSSIG
jgi:hypothetical protein